MFRALITWGVLGTLVASSIGCMSCNPCNPCGPCGGGGPYMPFDSQYCGCVDTGPLGTPRPGCAQRREMRRAMRNAQACPTCQGSMDMGIMGDVGPGMNYGAPAGGSFCPTCQQQFSSPSTMMSPMGTPVPMSTQPDLSFPTPQPAPVPSPTPTTSNQIHPTSGQYFVPGSQAYSPPPQVQAFNSYNPQPSQQMLYAP